MHVQNKALFDREEDENKGFGRKWRVGLINLEVSGWCKGFKSHRVFCIDWFILAAISFSIEVEVLNCVVTRRS